MKKDCIYCGQKDNEVHLIEDCDINRHLYDWYAFECKGCDYKCSFSVVKKEPTQDNSKIICRIRNTIIERLKRQDLNVDSFLQTHAKDNKYAWTI